MTEDEIMQRAREAVIATFYGDHAADIRAGGWDSGEAVTIAARALRDASKPLPVDPDALLAREVCAAWYEADGRPETAAYHRAGKYDKGDTMQEIVLAAIKAARKQDSV